MSRVVQVVRRQGTVEDLPSTIRLPETVAAGR